MINFVKIQWASKLPARGPEKIGVILADPNLGWAAKGLGCYLTQRKEGIRFANNIFDGTMDALAELRKEGYLTVTELKEHGD